MRYTAQQILAEAQALGLPWIAYTEGGDEEVSFVQLTPLLAIVSDDENGVRLMQEQPTGIDNTSDWHSHPLRRNVAALLPDYRKALGLEGQQ